MIRALLFLFAVVSILNAGWMLVDPAGWYTNLPAHVGEYGPLNTHFVRDIGIAFLASGIGLALAASDPPQKWRYAVLPALFFAGHALVHLSDCLRHGPAAHLWKGELLLVYLPAMVLCYLVILLRSKFPHQRGS